MENDPYLPFDVILVPWAHANGLEVQRDDRGYVVRSIWLRSMRNPGPIGQEPQLWLGWPVGDDEVEVNVAVGRWMHTARATLSTLASVLDQQLDFLKSRSGPAN